MTLQIIELIQDSPRPVHEMFSMLADHNKLSQVVGIPVRRIQDGEGDVNGVASVRRLGFPLGIEETVTAFEPGRTIGYRISKGGFPIRNHRGRIDFASASGGGSRVTWTIEFDSALPLAGPMVKFLLSKAIGSGLKRVASASQT